MELRHLRYAVAVAEEGSFTRAAARLHLVQQALSQQVANLERELGVRLFERIPRGILVTEAGSVFIEEAVATLTHVDRTIRRLRQRTPGERPVLRVGASRSFEASNRLVGAAIRRFHEAEPTVQVGLVELSPDLHADALLEGRLDVAFTHAPLKHSAVLESEQVWEELWTAVLLPARHPLATRHPLWLRELTGLPMIGFPREINPVLHGRIIAALEERGLSPTLASVQLSGFPEAEAELVAAGIGWRLMVPSARAQFRGVPGVAFRCFADDPIPRLGLWVLSRREDSSPLLPRFLAAVQSCLGTDQPSTAAANAWRSLG